MVDDVCVFAMTQIANEFSCQNAQRVTRRNGPDIECCDASAHQQCVDIYAYLKLIGLDEFGLDDDLTQVPHGTWAKIQFGGLMALESINAGHDVSRVENITHTIQCIKRQYASLDELPREQVLTAMRNYRIRRRKK